MTDEEITICEALYLCIDNKLISYDLVDIFYDNVKNTEMDAYMYWLINRWPLLRKHKNIYLSDLKKTLKPFI